MKKWDVIVVGGGAAGMMAAARAGERGKRVLLLEKNNHLGEKLKITGGGRCNITNAEFDEHILLKQYGKAASFLFSPFSQFGVQSTFDFFQSKGLPLVIQDGNRAFPRTENAVDVQKVMEKYARESGVIVKTGAHISRIMRESNKVIGVATQNDEYEAGAVVLSTGGSSHPETGSTGDGFKWLRDLGHTVHMPTPSIVPLAVSEVALHTLKGVSVSPAKITYFLNGAKQFSRTGDLLFTHFGISGPVVLNSSAAVGDLLHVGRVTASIDFFPMTNERELDDRMKALFEEHKNKTLKNIFNHLAPQQLLGCMKGVQSETKVHSVTKEQRKILVCTLKSLPLTITKLMGMDRAVVVDGGLDLREVHNKTMRSTLFENVYVVGDLLHINRPSGGYSLQLCWTTGWVAGNSV